MPITIGISPETITKEEALNLLHKVYKSSSSLSNEEYKKLKTYITFT